MGISSIVKDCIVLIEYFLNEDGVQSNMKPNTGDNVSVITERKQFTGKVIECHDDYLHLKDCRRYSIDEKPLTGMGRYLGDYFIPRGKILSLKVVR